MSQIRIAAIYDNRKTADRYTVITDWVAAGEEPMRDEFMYLGCGEGGEWLYNRLMEFDDLEFNGSAKEED